MKKRDARRFGPGGRPSRLDQPSRLRPGPWSDGAATGPAAAGDHVHDDDHDHRADDGGDDRADVERSVDDVLVEEGAGEEATDDRADDAEHDMTDDPESFVALDEEAGQVAGNRAEDDPRND